MNIDWTKILYSLLTIFIVMNIGLVLQGIMRKLGARVGRRHGIRIYQAYIDLIKNYSIRSSISHGVMYFLGPVFRLAGGVGMLLFLPVIYGDPRFDNFSYAGDTTLIMYFMFLGTLGMALGAGEAGHPYSPMGIARGLAQMTASEVPLVLAVISVMAQYHTFNISEIVAAQQGGITHWTLFTNPFATTAAMLSFLGAMGRAPFSVVTAPQEIPIGPPTEFNSTFLAVLQTNRAIFPVAKVIWYMALFFGGATSWPILIVKAVIIYFWSVFVGVVFPRFRPEQAIRWFIKVPALLGVIAIILV